MTFEEWNKTESIEPIKKYMQHGNEIQLCRITFPHSVILTERTFFPYFFLNPVMVIYIMDLVLPIMSECHDKVKEFGGDLITGYYTADGFGMPEFNSLEEAWKFNEWYHEREKEERI